MNRLCQRLLCLRKIGRLQQHINSRLHRFQGQFPGIILLGDRPHLKAVCDHDPRKTQLVPEYIVDQLRRNGCRYIINLCGRDMSDHYHVGFRVNARLKDSPLLCRHLIRTFVCKSRLRMRILVCLPVSRKMFQAADDTGIMKTSYRLRHQQSRLGEIIAVSAFSDNRIIVI